MNVHTNLVKRHNVGKPPSGVYSLGDKLFFFAVDSGALHVLDVATYGVETPADTRHTRTAGLSYHNGHLYFLDPVSATLHKMAVDGYASEMVLDLSQVDVGNHHPALHTAGRTLTDIDVNDTSLLCCVKAGYSSSVYEIDLATARVKNSFFAKGPAPTGVTRAARAPVIYVAEASQGFLVEFDNEGKHTGQAAKLPTDAPFGLSGDAAGNYYVGAQDTGAIIQFTVGG
jgi:DNA-binding beta-propeller fold protein YncE